MPIPNYPGYFVDEFGGVWSTKGKKGRLRFLKPKLTKAGHLSVHLSMGGKTVHRFVHRLVLEAFTGLRPKGFVTRHLNGNKADNSPDNLRWGTPQENSDDAVRLGEQPHGTECWLSKLDWNKVDEIRTNSNITAAEFARKFNVSSEAIATVRKSKT